MAKRIPYDPLSRFTGLGSDILAQIDRSEFPSHVDALLAAEIDALERRYACLFVVYVPAPARGERGLCEHAEAVWLTSGEVPDVRRVESDFDVWLVAYQRSLSSDRKP